MAVRGMDDDGIYIDEEIRRRVVALGRRGGGASPRRAVLTEGLAALHRLVVGLVGAARRLDTRLWPEHREVDLEAPVFIVAAPRSGTTFLHRLMCLDERFFYLKLYQTILPSIALCRLVERAGGLGGPVGEALEEVVERVERLAFGGWEEIHRLGFGRAEEDEGLFVLTLVTPALYLLVPEIDRLRRPAALDTLDEETRRRVMDFYESSLARVKYLRGRDKRFLGKTVLAAGRLESMLERFPQARFIHLVRHPYRTVPSFVSMFRRPWRAHSPQIDDRSPRIRRLADLAIAYYRNVHRATRRLDDARVTTVAFDELVSDPRATIADIYAWLGLEPTVEFERRVEAELEAGDDGAGEHEYALEQFGLTRGEIHARLREVFDAYGFEP